MVNGYWNFCLLLRRAKVLGYYNVNGFYLIYYWRAPETINENIDVLTMVCVCTNIHLVDTIVHRSKHFKRESLSDADAIIGFIL